MGLIDIKKKGMNIRTFVKKQKWANITLFRDNNNLCPSKQLDKFVLYGLNKSVSFLVGLSLGVIITDKYSSLGHTVKTERHHRRVLTSSHPCFKFPANTLSVWSQREASLYGNCGIFPLCSILVPQERTEIGKNWNMEPNLKDSNSCNFYMRILKWIDY